MRYRYNSSCPCPRCRAHGYMGPAVLITIGVLFLFDQMGGMHWMHFGFTWPALLIVIGPIKLLEDSASMAAHIQPQHGPSGWQARDPRYGTPPYTGQPAPPPGTGYPQPPIVSPPPVSQAGFIAPGSPVKGPDEQGGA